MPPRPDACVRVIEFRTGFLETRLALGTPRLAWMMRRDSGNPPRFAQTMLGTLVAVLLVMLGLVYQSDRSQLTIRAIGSDSQTAIVNAWTTLNAMSATVTRALNGTWPPWVNNIANLGGIATLIVAVLAWLYRRIRRPRT